MKALLIVTAVLEAGISIALLTVPSLVAQILLGATLDAPASLAVAPVAGAALLALGVVCWLAQYDTENCAARAVVSGMMLYNLGAAVVLAAAGRAQPSGIALWSTVILHAAMAVWCLVSLFGKRTIPST